MGLKDNSLKQARRMMMGMRAGYIVALSVMVIMCAMLYLEQRENENRIKNTVELSNKLSAVSNGFTRAAKLSYVTIRTYSSNAVDERIKGMTFKERIAFYKTAEPEMKIRIAKTTAIRIMDKLYHQTLDLDALWWQAPKEFRQELIDRNIINASAKPFSKYEEVAENILLKRAKSEVHMYVAANKFIDEYESFIQSHIVRAQDFLKRYLSDFVEKQSNEQSDFFLVILTALVILGFFVFLPIDITLRRLFSKLVEKTNVANKALKEAQAADKAKSEFLATMSHEIRTPMNGVLGMAELLSRTELDTRQKTFSDVIIKSGNALLAIINDILDFSKIEAAQLSLVEAPFNLSESIEDITSLMSGKAAEKNIELLVKVDQTIPQSVMGDQGRLRQVLTNLVGNAVKFTEEGHVFLKATIQPLHSEDKDGHIRIGFEISDTGMGIPEDQIGSVFEKFSQVDGSKSRKHEGTGLGLAISARLIALMGGNIRVTSELNVGSTFSFSIALPIDQDVKNVSDQPLAKVAHSRILIIDDNSINRAILTEYCQGWGHDCVAVEAGAIGLKFLEHSAQEFSSPVDIVILDFHMPDMNGADVIRAIRANPAIAKTPILILSSVDQADELADLGDMEVEGFLTKPARNNILQSTLNSILKKKMVRESREQVSTVQSIVDNKRKVSTRQSIKPASNDKLPEAIQQEESVEQLAKSSQLAVLVAEDNAVNQIVFTEALKQFERDFMIVSDGLEAVKAWQEERPKVVVMDVSMPNMSGHEASVEIRKIEQKLGLERTPIIAVTAHAQKSDRENCLEAGMDDYMTKPISPEMLNDKISHWLDEQGSEGKVSGNSG
ncbi:response regulator [Lentilitoribacter sp. EG35]|uniref:response regulator n=1 Tax=Lentilitoribacter sp. EG35 TaxID=3234192 RepID=UPI00345F416E